MKVLTYRIKLLEPVLMTMVEGDPNSAVSPNYLPGGVLRGALIQKYLRDKGVPAGQLLEPGNAQAAQLFFSGQARFLNGYIAAHDQRVLPTPLAWQQRKDEPQKIYDFAVQEVCDDKKWGGVDKHCYAIDGAQLHPIELRRLVTVHTQRDRKHGRPMKNAGEVYRYEALAAGQTFEAAIVCDDTAPLAELSGLLTGEIHIGGSRNGGYGRAELLQAAEKDGAWRETGAAPLQLTAGQPLTLTFLSDALIRDENGQYTTDCHVIEKWLREQKLKDVPLKFKEAFVRGRAAGGFNRKWGLPLPQGVAVQMGSVFVFKLPEGDAAQRQTLTAKLAALEEAGIGERRAEGYGRVAVNWHTREQWTVVKPRKNATKSAAAEPPPVSIEDAASRQLARKMTERMLRARLDEAVIVAAKDLHVKPAPQPAQIARLRSLIADELLKPQPGLKRLTDFMTQVEKRSAARKQFEAARIGEERTRLLIWLKESEAKVADRAQLLTRDLPAIGVGNVRAEVHDSLRAEYVLRLIDTILARAAKQREEGK
jgi:CRISPR-associated protein Csx10